MAADSETHVAAVEQAGVPRREPDPLSRVFFQFERRQLWVGAAAAELGVTIEQLLESLPRLPPAFGALATPRGRIDRAALTSAFSAALCTLRSGERNHPLGCP
jgi:hypothetical protein